MNFYGLQRFGTGSSPTHKCAPYGGRTCELTEHAPLWGAQDRQETLTVDTAPSRPHVEMHMRPAASVISIQSSSALLRAHEAV